MLQQKGDTALCSTPRDFDAAIAAFKAGIQLNLGSRRFCDPYIDASTAKRFSTSLIVAEDGRNKRDQARAECRRLHAAGADALSKGKSSKDMAELFNAKRSFKSGLDLAAKSAEDPEFVASMGVGLEETQAAMTTVANQEQADVLYKKAAEALKNGDFTQAKGQAEEAIPLCQDDISRSVVTDVLHEAENGIAAVEQAHEEVAAGTASMGNMEFGPVG